MRVETKLVHAGEPRPRHERAVTMPIYQSSTFEYAGATDYHDIQYIRLNNTPNHVALHAKIAALEGTEQALVAASGMAAISSTLLSLLSAGDHVLAHDGLYGGTFDLLTQDLPRLGITCTFVDASRPETWAAHATPRTRVFYVETITNPLVQVVALDEVARFARERGITSVIDNTVATPINYRPAEHGFDLVVHSATKYLNGHNDIVAGAVAGRAELVSAVKHKLDHLGGSLDPHACFLLHRGLKTLAVRVRHQCQSALELAGYLARHPQVAAVHYPGLERHPHHARARQWFAGAGGLLSFELTGGAAAAEQMFRRLTLPLVAPSLGGPETLITRPATTSHAGLPADIRRRQGITDGLIRLSVGLESTQDLIDDFAAALG
ncbi:MAG: aminotransferase class I/II-fold pyridoxal phosphate-dependent enzyme [Deltaproteobacteria bacterium]|nr:MAG: aminotransferase class I/II-fold pyridoxal phosphate-dependent enzyme [Deltaproteobacteria bacterium]